MTDTTPSKPTADSSDQASSLREAASASDAQVPEPPREVLEDDPSRVWLATRSAARQIYQSQLPRMAAALAYRTIFAIVPVLVIVVAVVGALASQDDVKTVIQNVFRYTQIDQIVLDAEELPEVPAGETTAADPAKAVAAGEAAPETAPETGEPAETAEAASAAARLDEWIGGVVAGVDDAPLRAIGAVGVAALAYAAIGFLIEIERAFNNIYRAPAGRAWVRRLTNYTTLLLLGPILLFATFYVGSLLSGLLTDLAGGDDSSIPILTDLAGSSVGVMISTVLLFLVYQTIPNANVHKRAAAGGAFVAALMWEGAKFGLVTYLSTFSGGVERLYGALALIPIFMLWVYVTWLLVLFGLQVSYILQHVRDAADGSTSEDPTFVDPAGVLIVAAEIARRYNDGKPIDAEGLCRQTGFEPRLVDRMLEALIEADVIVRVDRRDNDPAFTPARPPSGIAAADVLTVGFDLSSRLSSPGRLDAIRDIRRAQIAALRGRSIMDVAGRDEKSAGGLDRHSAPGTIAATTTGIA